MKLLQRMLTSLIFILVTCWLLLVVLIYGFQSKFIYYPHKSITITPASVNLAYEDIYIQSDNNTSIHGWFIPHKNARATLLFFHGNAGNISHRLDSLKIFHDLGLSVFIIDYQGYGQSEGVPSEQGTYRDAQAAWNYLITQRNLKPADIIIFGRSLGAAVAIWLAHKNTPTSLIIESAFTSIIDMGKHIYPYLPVQWLARIHYPNIDRIAAVNCPILVMHSGDDEIIPYTFGQQLFQAASVPKDFFQMSGGHNDGFLTTGNTYIEALNSFIDKSIITN